MRLGLGADDDQDRAQRPQAQRRFGRPDRDDVEDRRTRVEDHDPNGDDFLIKLVIEDQLRRQREARISKVEMLPSTTPPTATNLRDKRGVLEWAFEAKAGEVSDISFAWRVRWPKDKGVVMIPAG